MMGVYTSVQDILDGAIKQVPGIPTLAYENYYFEPKLKTPWVRTTMLPTESSAFTLGEEGYDQIPALYQIDLFFPVNTGSKQANTLADSIIDYFDTNSLLSDDLLCVRVVSKWRLPSIQNGDWFQVPVTLRIEAYY